MTSTTIFVGEGTRPGDVCFDSKDGGSKPCHYFARGFCINGGNRKFMHGGFVDSGDASGEGFSDQQRRFGSSSQFMAGESSSSYKYMNFLLKRQNDPQRASAGAPMMGDEFHKFSLYRSDLFSLAAAEKRNSASKFHSLGPNRGLTDVLVRGVECN